MQSSPPKICSRLLARAALTRVLDALERFDVCDPRIRLAIPVQIVVQGNNVRYEEVVVNSYRMSAFGQKRTFV